MRTFALTAAVVAAIAVPAASSASTQISSVVHLSAPVSGLRYDQKTVHAHAGRIKIVFLNRSALKHNVNVENGEHELGKTMTGKAIPRILSVVRWFERWARPRFPRFLDLRPVKSLLAVFLLVFVVAAFVAPPFSGLDTAPSLGVVIVCLGIIFSDVIIVSLGLLVGASGIALVILLGSVAWRAL